LAGGVAQVAETRIRRNVPQHNKGYIWQAYCQHHTEWGKTENVSSKVRNQTRVFTLSTFIHVALKFLDRAIRQEEDLKGIHVGNEEVKLSIFVDDMILYLKDKKKLCQKTCRYHKCLQ
jgi:hypothetical protein